MFNALFNSKEDPALAKRHIYTHIITVITKCEKAIKEEKEEVCFSLGKDDKCKIPLVNNTIGGKLFLQFLANYKAALRKGLEEKLGGDYFPKDM